MDAWYWVGAASLVLSMVVAVGRTRQLSNRRDPFWGTLLNPDSDEVDLRRPAGVPVDRSSVG
jgi:hypothetical protein